MAVSNYIITII